MVEIMFQDKMHHKQTCFKIRCITSKQQHDNYKNHRGCGVERLQLAPAWGVSNDRRGNVNTTRLFVLMGWDGWDGMDGMGWAEWDGRNGMGWDGMGWDGMGWDGMGWDGME